MHAGLLVFFVLFGALPLAHAGETTRVSLDSAGVEGNGSSVDASISASGRFVAFTSDASNFVAGDGNGTNDIFVRDRKQGKITRVSLDSVGTEGNQDAFQPAISASGRFVAFGSDASNLVAGDGNGDVDVFVHDRKLGKTTRVSVDSAGVEGNDFSSEPSISASGRFVAFLSEASNLVSGGSNGLVAAFVHDRKSGKTRRVSVDSAGAEGNGLSSELSISANGRFVAFTSVATNLVPGDRNGTADVFVHDRKTGTTTRVSVDSAGLEGNNFSVEPSISANGRFVAFTSFASNLVPGDGNGTRDILVHDRKTGTTTRVSLDSAGVEGNGLSRRPSISASGRFVSFRSQASNLVAGDGNDTWDVFVHDRKTGKTARVSVDSAGVEGNNASFEPSISANGRFTAFESDASDFVPDDGNGVRDVFLHDRK